ncbi:DUF1553 domain-containing protein [Isosphaeraceae bacterium EP7]
MRPKRVCQSASAAMAFFVMALSGSSASSGGELARIPTTREQRTLEFRSLPPVPDPPTPAGENPIDSILAGWRKAQKTELRAPVDASLFARKIHLDLIGLLPTPGDVEVYKARPDPAKTADALLGDTRGYAEHWMTFWNDLLRNDEQTSIDGLRKPITPWLYRSLVENKPYDQMVEELLSPGPGGPDGYLMGVNWRGRVNLSQRPPVQAAQNVAQVFLATSIRCASCHDGFTTPWKLKDAYGLAAFFSEGTLETARCEKPTGVFAPAKFLYDGLGDVAADADLSTRRAAVAGMVTRPKNPRFARVLVNRLWDRLMGRALAEPIDEMTEPTCAELLDWLAYDFMGHDYDLKHTIKLIVTSKAYAQSVAEGEAVGEPNELGPVPRRLSAEQFIDAFSRLTGYWARPAELMNIPLDGPEVRAWRHRRPSPLAVALGRPTREQVTTKRVESATVLQALEATNGKTLGDLVSKGAETLLASDWAKDADAVKAANLLFLRAYSRPASPEELAFVGPMLGHPGDPVEARREGLEDLLWIVINSPEFQVIR